MLEQVLQVLPEPCPYAKKGCSRMDLPSHSQYCGYRPIRCVVGTDYSCTWSGTVKDWIDHVKSAHLIYDHLSIKNYSCNLNYRKFTGKDSWTICVSVHCFDNTYFLVLCMKKNEKLYETVKHVPLGKTDSQYFLETTIRNHSKKDVLYRVVLTSALLMEDDLFENIATSFTFEDLIKFAVSEGSLIMSCKFTKQ